MSACFQPCWGPIPNITGGGECICSGDDWECFKPAQLHLLHMAARAPGCTVIITGDLGYSDIKVRGAGIDYGVYEAGSIVSMQRMW